MNPSDWTGPRPCPLCHYANKEEDTALLERYKVRPGLGVWEEGRLALYGLFLVNIPPSDSEE